MRKRKSEKDIWNKLHWSDVVGDLLCEFELVQTHLHSILDCLCRVQGRPDIQLSKPDIQDEGLWPSKFIFIIKVPFVFQVLLYLLALMIIIQ